MTVILVAVFTSISTGLGPELLAQGRRTVSFDEIVRVFERNGCIRCHRGSRPAADVDLRPADAWENIVNQRSGQARRMYLVAPGDVDESYLYLKLVDRHLQRGGRGVAMPIGRSRVSNEDLDIVESWIDDGAPR